MYAENCFNLLEDVAEEQLPIPAVNDKWQLIQQDIKANSKLKLPPSFILHRPTENLVVGPSNLLLLEWLCINNCIDAVKYRIQPHKYDQDQIKWLYEISELCKSPEVASFLQPLVQNIEPSRLVLSSLIDNHPQQFIEILIKAGASSYSYTLLKKAIERCHNVTVQAIVDNRNHIENRAAYDAVKFGNAEAVKILANAGANLGWSDYFTEYTPLKIAIDTENTEIVKILLEYGVDVNSENHYTQSRKGAKTQRKPLHLAALKDNRKIVKLLINAGATMDITSSDWHSLSQSLEQQGNISMVHFILNSLSKRSSSVENNTLCAAVQNKQLDLVQKLISNKEKVDEIDLDGYAPLHWTVIVGDEEIIKSLIRAGADLDVRASNEPHMLHSTSAPNCFSECTPLHIAVSKKHLGIARLLVEAGADFSAKNGLQQTIMDIAKEDREEIEKIIMECAPVNIISIRRAMKSTSHENIKTMISNQQINAKLLSECLCIAASNGENALVKYLLHCGVNINKVYQGNTPLWWAIFWGNIQAMEILINAGADLNIKSINQESPLLQCVKESQVDMAQFLVDKGADVNAGDKYGNVPIHYTNDKDILEILINAGADINIKSQYGITCLIQHVSESDTEMVQFLVDKRADVNARDKNGNAPIHCVKSKDILKILIDAGADINARDPHGATCLIQHVKESKTEIVQFLVDKRADVNASDKYGNTPIHYAKSKNVLEILIDAGANINARDPHGVACLIQHVKEFKTEIVQFLVDKGADVNARDGNGNAPIYCVKSKYIFEILINAGADINARDPHVATCLIQHIRELNTKIVRFLIDKGVDVNASDKYGNTPIHYAKSKKVLEILIDAGADINARDPHGATCLIQHVRKSNKKKVQFLVDKGADVNASDKYGNTPIHYAKSKNVLEILIDAGADINARDPHGVACLIQHVKESKTEIVQFLVDKGADVNARDGNGNAPIHYANNKDILEILINAGAYFNARDSYRIIHLIQHVEKSNTEMVQSLVDKGADVNNRDKNGNAPIHCVKSKDILEILINAGADINVKDQYGATCLIQHIRKSNTKIVQFLVDKGADVNASDKYGNAPIHYANKKDILEILINAGAYFNANSQYGTTRLIQYVRKSQAEMVQFLVDKGADVNARDEDGNAPIQCANSKSVLEILINAGADINAKNKYRTTCLIQHVSESEVEIVQFLIDKGADVNARDGNRNASIHYAKGKNVLEILINAGADINAKDQYGITCLIQYVRKSDAEVVQFLVDKGADVNTRDEYGNASIHCVKSKDILEILIDAGADINARDPHGATCLIQHVSESNTIIVQFLVDKGADVNARDEYENAPIHYAKSKDILEILVNAGANINVKDQYGATCLIQHVRKSSIEVVQFLVDKGPDINTSDKDGNEPIHFVRDKEIAEILITAGADISVKDRYGKILFDILIEEQNRNLSNNQYKRKKVCELLEYLRAINKV